MLRATAEAPSSSCAKVRFTGDATTTAAAVAGTSNERRATSPTIQLTTRAADLATTQRIAVPDTESRSSFILMSHNSAALRRLRGTQAACPRSGPARSLRRSVVCHTLVDAFSRVRSYVLTARRRVAERPAPALAPQRAPSAVWVSASRVRPVAEQQGQQLGAITYRVAQGTGLAVEGPLPVPCVVNAPTRFLRAMLRRRQRGVQRPHWGTPRREASIVTVPRRRRYRGEWSRCNALSCRTVVADDCAQRLWGEPVLPRRATRQRWGCGCSSP